MGDHYSDNYGLAYNKYMEGGHIHSVLMAHLSPVSVVLSSLAQGLLGLDQPLASDSEAQGLQVNGRPQDLSASQIMTASGRVSFHTSVSPTGLVCLENLD